MQENHEIYLNAEQAQRMGFKGCCIVGKIDRGNLRDEWRRVYQQFIDQIPMLEQLIADPRIPHLTFCWPNPETEDVRISRAIESWTVNNRIIRIRCELIEHYSEPFGAPYIAVVKSPPLLTARANLVQRLNQVEIPVEDHDWNIPHLSLFYYLENPDLETTHQVESLVNNITMTPRFYTIRTIDLVRFQDSGEQLVHSFVLR